MTETKQENPSPGAEAAPDSGPARGTRIGQLVAFTLIAALLALLGWGLAKAQSGPRSAGPAPEFTLTSFTGETFTLSEHRGHVVVINFWASWCPPCREEAPYLERTWRKYQDQGVVFIGVDYADAEPEALAYIDEFDITYFNGPDLGTRIAQAYNIQGVPETFFIAKNGELREPYIGPLYPPLLDEFIDELLQVFITPFFLEIFSHGLS